MGVSGDIRYEVMKEQYFKLIDLYAAVCKEVAELKAERKEGEKE